MTPTRYDTLFQNKWIHLVNEGGWTYVRRTSGVVVVVPVTEHGELIMVEQPRRPVRSHTLELPAGLIDPGETPSEAAVRELYEETGYWACGGVQYLCQAPSSPGLTDETPRFYTATRCVKGNKGPEPGIVLHVNRDFGWAIRQNRLPVSAHTLAGLYLFFAWGPGGRKMPG